MPTGFSAAVALNTFLAVVIVGSAWRLISLHFIGSASPQLRTLGQAMAFQY
jgi:hypothetical protein